jgi:hypothetical protein
MGAYTVFLDVALGFGSPALGLIAGRFGAQAGGIPTENLQGRRKIRRYAVFY